MSNSIFLAILVTSLATFSSRILGVITSEKIKEKIPDVSIETTPLPFQDARNYQVSSDKLKLETGFEASIELTQGIEEMYNLISSNRIKDINDPRYSNQNFLQTYGVK